MNMILILPKSMFFLNKDEDDTENNKILIYMKHKSNI